MIKNGHGSYCFFIDEEIDGKRVIDVIVGQNFHQAFHNMISKEDKASLMARYC